MSEELESIVALAEASARASAERMAEEARERAARPVLPPVTADPLPRENAAPRPQAPSAGSVQQMAFTGQSSASTSAGSEDAFGEDDELEWRTFSTCDDETITVLCKKSSS